jgi:hypothetical protein
MYFFVFNPINKEHDLTLNYKLKSTLIILEFLKRLKKLFFFGILFSSKKKSKSNLVSSFDWDILER